MITIWGLMLFMKLPTLIFDLGGVYFTDGTARAISIICERYTLDVDIVANIFSGDVGTAYRENKITNDVFWDIAKNKWGIIHVSSKELSQIWFDGYVPITAVVEIIQSLRREGYETLFLSGSTSDRALYLEKKYRFSKHFDDGLFSFDIGVRKPALLPYTTILKKTSNSPQNCILIENSEENLVPAKSLGMQTLLYSDSDKLRVDLIERGLHF